MTLWLVARSSQTFLGPLGGVYAINETLKFYGLPTDQFTFQVFNLAGKEIFRTEQKDDYWDGFQQNGDLIKGSYVYQINYYTEENELLTQQGSFVLIN